MTSRRQFFEFGPIPFRDELLVEYVRPAARWFLGEQSTAYLIPQVSGSNWECALAVEGLLDLVESDAGLEPQVRAAILDKCLATVRWMLTQLDWLDADACTWDGVTWDTAVCARVLLVAREKFSGTWGPSEIETIDRAQRGVVRWLVDRSVNWDRDVRYPAGPPDLAQVLNTLVLVAENDSAVLSEAESAAGVEANSSLTRIVRILLAMEQHTELVIDGATAPLSYWVDCFNTSEVAEGLSAYLAYISRSDSLAEVASSETDVRQALYRSLRYIELNQSDATWGGVADTCGTLYGYLKVIRRLPDFEASDHVVFRALRWMCDEKQSLADGSFLHTSYVTVFYLHALLQTYHGWALGSRTASEVYDIALWSAPVQATVERSRRLELQLDLQDARRSLDHKSQQVATWRQSLLASVVFLAQMGILLVALRLSKSWGVDWSSLDFELKDPSQFWTIVGIGTPVAITLTGGVVAIIERSRKQ